MKGNRKLSDVDYEITKIRGHCQTNVVHVQRLKSYQERKKDTGLCETPQTLPSGEVDLGAGVIDRQSRISFMYQMRYEWDMSRKRKTWVSKSTLLRKNSRATPQIAVVVLFTLLNELVRGLRGVAN